jgi:hypothetical protein
MIQTFVLNYMRKLSHKKEENLFPCNFVCTEIWKKTHDYRLEDTILSTEHNSILDINWLFLTQCQQPLFFCIILLELADDFQKSYGDGHSTNTTARRLKVFIKLCKSTCPIETNNQSSPKLRILSYETSHCVAWSLQAVWHPTAPGSATSALRKPPIS